jgi:hypothetical protein
MPLQKNNAMADKFLKDLVNASKQQVEPRTTRLYTAPATSRERERKRLETKQKQQLVEERKRLKSAATTAELAQQQEASIFPHASTGLGAVLNYEFLAKHNNSERRTASSSAKSRFLKSRGRSIGSDGLARTTTSPEQHRSVVPNQGDTDLQLDHTTTLLQLRQHHQLATAHHQYQTLHPNNNDTPSVPHLYAPTASHNQVVDDQGHD